MYTQKLIIKKNIFFCIICKNERKKQILITKKIEKALFIRTKQ